MLTYTHTKLNNRLGRQTWYPLNFLIEEDGGLGVVKPLCQPNNVLIFSNECWLFILYFVLENPDGWGFSSPTHKRCLAASLMLGVLGISIIAEKHHD